MTTAPPGRAQDVPNETYLASLYLVLIVAYADERLAEEERSMLRKQVLTLCETIEDVRGFKSFIDSLPETVESDGWVEGALSTIKEKLTDPEAVRQAFAMALEVAVADGKIDIRETCALLEIADRLDVDPEFAQARLRRVKATPQDQLPDLSKTPWQGQPVEKKS